MALSLENICYTKRNLELPSAETSVTRMLTLVGYIIVFHNDVKHLQYLDIWKVRACRYDFVNWQSCVASLPGACDATTACLKWGFGSHLKLMFMNYKV